MKKAMTEERRMGQRFEISLPIRLEWDEEDGNRMIEEGRTENVSPYGTLVHLPRHLPRVGSNVRLAVFEAKGVEVINVQARVLRIERNPAHPLAALTLTEAAEEWRKHIWLNDTLIESFTENADDYEE